MHQLPLNYFTSPAGLTAAQANPKAFQKFANLFPNVTQNAMAAAVSSLNPFSIENLLAGPSQQQQTQMSNYSNVMTSSPNSQKVSSNAYSPVQPSPSDLYGKIIIT